MGKRAWVAGAVGLLLGLAAGSACTYFWPKPRLAATSVQGAEAVIPPDPSAQEVQATFQSMLADAGVDAEVMGFRRVTWTHDTKHWEPDGQGRFKKLANPVTNGLYSVVYEAELQFRGECQIKENFQLMWSTGNVINSFATGLGPVMTTRETRSFKKGERQQVRGLIYYTSHSGQWKLQPNCKIDAGR